MDEKTITLGLFTQLISAEISHSGIDSISNKTIEKAKDIIKLISDKLL